MTYSDFLELLRNPFTQVLIIIFVGSLLQLTSQSLVDKIVRRLVLPHRYESRADERKREDTIINIVRTLVTFALWVIIILLILNIIGVNLAALLTGAGLFGIIIGLGAQNTIKDILAGLFILTENQYRVGDIVTLKGGPTGLGTSGLVEDITLRITKLRDLDGTLNIIRNGEASIITNRTFNFSSVVIDVTVGYDSDIDKVKKIMTDIGTAVAADEVFSKLTVEPIQFVRVEAFTDNGVTVRALGKVVPAAQWDVAGEYRYRLLHEFRKHHIQFALPQLIVNSLNKK